MYPAIDEQVVSFYNALFESIFSEPFRPQITQLIKRRTVERQVQEASDAASQSLTRFLINQQLSEQQVADMLESFSCLGDRLKLDDIANPNVAPETIVNNLLTDLPCPGTISQTNQDAVYRVALHSIVQVLTMVGPVMAEWQKLNFSSTFELPRRVVNRLNQISEQLDALSSSGQAAVDERYELSYRDYLLQRFHRVEAGTVRMTTNMDVDLRELFVMPRVLARTQPKDSDSDQPTDPTALMDLTAARRVFGDREEFGERIEPKDEKDAGIEAALNRVNLEGDNER